VATALLFEFQLITRPVSMLLSASRVTAESCAVPPTWRLAVAGDTDTDATGAGAGALTVIAAEAVCPSLVAVIDTLPGATAVTSPDAETVATAVLLELQVITRPVSTLLLASRETAESCTVPPTWRVDVAGDTDTDATGIGAGAVVEAEAMLERPLNTALTFSVPRNATNWKL
jgi:hypothetical protein